MTSYPAGRIVVLSPHLDDAVLSLGAYISGAAGRGVRVDVVTVFAGNVGSDAAAGEWDRAAGFRSEGEAARARRREDQAACRILGATPVWLSFRDDQYGEDAYDDALWEAIAPHLEGADAVLVPGFPLEHDDHARLMALVVSRAPEEMRIGLYAEQPYASWRGRPSTTAPTPAMAEDVVWRPARAGPRDRRRKWRACLAYRSQVRRFLRDSPLLPLRLVRYERRGGGESVAWLSSRNRHL